MNRRSHNESGAAAPMEYDAAERHAAATREGDWRLQHLVRYGSNSFSTCLLYDRVSCFRCRACDGFIGFVASNGVCISLGEPVTSPLDYVTAAREFLAYCLEQGKGCVFVYVGEAFVNATSDIPWTRAVLGDDMIFDIPSYAPRGDRAKKVRSARNHAVKRGAVVREYDPGNARDPFLERQMVAVGRRWLKSLHRFQMRFLELDLFKMAELKRYFYAAVDGKVVGVLTCLPIYARNGYLLEDLIRDPDAPNGTTELLVLEALRRFKEEAIDIATLGLSPRVELHRDWGFSWWQVVLTRLGIRLADNTSGLHDLYHYRKKFHTQHSETAYLLKHPVGIGFRDLLGIMKAFTR